MCMTIKNDSVVHTGFSSSLLLFLDKLKGGSDLKRLPTLPDDVLTVTAKTFFGYTVRITVVRIVFRRHYHSSFFKDKDYMTYAVSSKVVGEAPERIVDAFDRTYTFPDLLHKSIATKHQMDKAIEAYMDMIIQENVRDLKA